MNDSIIQKSKCKTEGKHTTLDTLEVTSDLFFSKPHESLYHSALRKGYTNQTLVSLIDVSNKVWNKRYWKGFHCSKTKLQDGNTIKGSLCRQRWCQNCNRIKTAELRNAYEKPFKELQEEDDLYFITLTSPTVEKRKLSDEITKRYKAFTRIKDNLRKRYSINLVGCRKLEITYNKERNHYHPHFHFIQKGKKEAEMLLKLWLKQFPSANLKAQDIKLIPKNNDGKDLQEIFKYATKHEVNDKMSAEALHHIYACIRGKRLFQTYGKLKKVEEVKEAKNSEIKADWLEAGYHIWEFNDLTKDWINEYDEVMIGTESIKEELNAIKKYNDKLNMSQHNT